MKKRLLIIFISMILITVFLILIHGTDTKYIADYMPPLGENDEPWNVVKTRATFNVMKINLIIDLIITIGESIILFKNKILEKNLVSIFIIIALIIIPTAISTIVISNTFSYSC